MHETSATTGTPNYVSVLCVCVCVCHGRNAELASITSQDEDDYVADEMSVSDEIDESPKLQ